MKCGWRMLSERMRSIDVKYVHEFTLDLLTFFYLKFRFSFHPGCREGRERERERERRVQKCYTHTLKVAISMHLKGMK